MTARVRSLILEVERKFKPCDNFVRQLEARKGMPAFESLHRIDDSSFEDIYYDFENSLSSQGMWLRTRNGVWQAKVRIGGDRINSQFRETSVHSQIMSLVNRHAPQVDAKSVNFGLSPFAQFETYRMTWLADKRFKIVYDKTDFGHEVGEVELECSLLDTEDGEKENISLTQGMDDRIRTFMSKYHWIFGSDSQRPTGKITAYITHKQQMSKAGLA